MIPPLWMVLRTHDFVTHSRHLRKHRDEALIAEALRLAAGLAGDREEDEPAALLFTLSVRGKALGDAWEVAPWLLAKNHARALGFELSCPLPEKNALMDLRLNVAQKRGTFEDVRAWVAAHMRPL
jgi:hypothetical protein